MGRPATIQEMLRIQKVRREECAENPNHRLNLRAVVIGAGRSKAREQGPDVLATARTSGNGRATMALCTVIYFPVDIFLFLFGEKEVVNFGLWGRNVSFPCL